MSSCVSDTFRGFRFDRTICCKDRSLCTKVSTILSIHEFFSPLSVDTTYDNYLVDSPVSLQST